MFHRHEWRWAARHSEADAEMKRAVIWDIETCRCGARRKGYWQRIPAPDTGWSNTFEYPRHWSPA